MPTSVRRPHLLLITTSYPWVADGRKSAGSFVADFAEALTDHLEVSVVAPGPADRVEQRGALSVHFFAAARLPLSLLRPWVPADWPKCTAVSSAAGPSRRDSPALPAGVSGALAPQQRH